MNNNDAFGCTTFRKGNYLGRSYDFYCNDVASSVLHTGRIEGARYESIGMSGSSFNGMKKDKAIDGTIDKATMNTLFSSIVDGINENGVAISTLVVPRGDKGITTGTNLSKPSITARLVSRVVLDKAYSAKHAIKLLSELNLVQSWNNTFELHWMIADANDTYIVETVNNRLSYVGDEIEGLEEFCAGELIDDIITNFYISGFDKTQGDHTFMMPINNPTVTPHACGIERYKIIMDALEEVNGDLGSDEDAMKIINRVQYTNNYKDDTAWYSEFADHEHNNRSDVSEGSEYVTKVEGIKEVYQSIFSEGGKEAVRALGVQLGEGASWHSNHQCVYDLANKTMLVYPSENGEVAYRVDVHGVVEDEAVEIGGSNLEYLGYSESLQFYFYRVPTPPEDCIYEDEEFGSSVADGVMLSEDATYPVNFSYINSEELINQLDIQGLKKGDWVATSEFELAKGCIYIYATIDKSKESPILFC